MKGPPPIGYIDIFWVISTVDICRYLSMVVAFFLNVDFDVDFSRYFKKNVDIRCRFLSKYADICRKMSISVPILVDICRYMSKNVDICQYLLLRFMCQ